MTRWGGRWRSSLACLCACAALASCRAIVDSGITYKTCDRADVTEDFSSHGIEDLQQGACWGDDGIADTTDLFVDDGDLVLRTRAPADGATSQWSEDEQGPIFYQHFDRDFVMAIRVEALNQVSGDHCLADGNRAGIVVRRISEDGADDWWTFLIGPFALDDPAFDCSDASGMIPPTEGVTRSRSGDEVTERGPNDQGIGIEGEADIAACRVGSSLVFYYRDRTVPNGDWILVPGSFEPGDGGLDVGLTAAGDMGAFQVAAHVTWVGYNDTVGADGCGPELLRMKGLDTQ